MHQALLTIDRELIRYISDIIATEDSVAEPDFQNCFGPKAEDNVNRLFTSKIRYQKPLIIMYFA